MSLTHIETIELGSSQSSITFSSIPQDYDDLVVMFSARADLSDNSVNFIGFNGSTSGFTTVILNGDGSSASSFTSTNRFGLVPGTSQTANTFASQAGYVSNYTASQAKSYSVDFVTENNGTTAFQGIIAGLWNNTAAITSVELLPTSGNFVTGCVASLYGVTAGGDGTVTTS